MYTEIVKIIEGGLVNDQKKVISYAKHLATKLEDEGNDKLANKILNVLKNIKGLPVYQDKLFTAPVDNETRLNIATVITPPEIELNIKISDSIKGSIEEFVSLVNAKGKLNKLGIEVNSSLLLYGPPGAGKTRKLFDYANNRPCILFLDEFDAIAKARNDSQEMGELKRVINSLLQNIDEFTQNNILIAATNHEELLDKAIWRRFEKVIEIGKPNSDEIIDLLNLFLQGVDIDFKEDEKKLKILSSELNELSHSEIKKIITSSVSKSVIRDNRTVGFEYFLLEIFLYKNHNNKDLDKAIKYLNEHGVSQNSIKDIFDISLRQVRNILSPVL